MSHSNAPTGSRPRSALLIVIALATLFVTSALPASAAPSRPAAGPAATTTAATCPAPGPVDPSLPDIVTGVTVGPALVVTPGKPNRTLTASQATAFIQSWLPASVVQHLPPATPPANATVSHLLMTTSYAGTPTCITAWYAVLGKQVWVGMPAQSLGWASVQKDTWIAAPNPSFSVRAFAGLAKPVPGETTPTTTTTTAPSTTTGSATAKSSGSSGSSSWVWFVVAGVIVLAIIGGIALRSRARPRTAG
jgi:hypothetical protein